MRLSMKVGVCALVLVIGNGCAWQRARTNIADLHERIDLVQEGKTTTSELVDILGSPPNNIIALPEGKSILLYTFGDSKTESFNLFIVKFGKSNIGVDSALFIAQNNVVQEVSVSNNSRDLAWETWPFGG